MDFEVDGIDVTVLDDGLIDVVVDVAVVVFLLEVLELTTDEGFDGVLGVEGIVGKMISGV